MEQFVFECDCGRTHRSSTSAPPPGWEVEYGKATCDDCLTFAKSPEPKAAPQPPRDLSLSIRLYSGAYLDLEDPDASVIQPIDIAAGLRQCRFSGQTGPFYTIAQHSVLVLRLIEPRAKAVGGKRGLQLRRCALMHDAAEAFIHDITHPLKILLPDYRRVEAIMERRLFERFGVEWTLGRKQIVKEADMEALAIEKRDLTGSHDRWPMLDSVDQETVAAHHIKRAWHPDEAMDAFLREFESLFPTDTAERIAA